MVSKEGRSIFIRDDSNANRLRVLILSRRNDKITRATDIAPDEIIRDRHEHLKKKYPLHEIYFPVVDVELDEGTRATARFEGIFTEDEYCILNKMFYDDTAKKPLGENVYFNSSCLEHWENQLFVNSQKALLSFFLVKEIPWGENQTAEIRLLTERWSGKVIIEGLDGNGLVIASDQYEFDDDEMNNDIFTSVKKSGMERESLLESLLASTDFLIRSQVKNKTSRAYNGLYLYYDYDERIYRHPTWIWTWGIAVKALLNAAEIPEVAAHYSKDYLIRIADEIGEASLRFQMIDITHPASGLLLCRYDADLQYPEASSGFYSPADSLFMAGYGWMPLYASTGKSVYKEATILLTDSVRRVSTQYPTVIEQDYITALDEWKDWIMDESAFGMIGFSELYKRQPDAELQKLAKEYFDKLMGMFDRGDGFWNRLWFKAERRICQVEYNTKGFGWAMIGLLNAYKMLGEELYLQKAILLADNVISYQQEDGKWFMFLEEGERKDGHAGICEKSTALWSFLLYDLYELTGKTRFLNSARLALFYLINHQYTGIDKNGHGAIPVCASGSGLNFRQYFNMCTSYGVSFLSVALCKELRMNNI